MLRFIRVLERIEGELNYFENCDTEIQEQIRDLADYVSGELKAYRELVDVKPAAETLVVTPPP